MFKDYTLQTSGRRSMYAVIGGAAVGAVFVIAFVAYGFSAAVDFQYPSFTDVIIDIGGTGLLVFTLASAFWGIAIVIFGYSIWFALHKFGLRTWMAAMTSGFLVSVIAGLWMAPEMFSRAQFGWWATFANLAIFGGIGAFVALTTWRIAYKRPPSDPC